MKKIVLVSAIMLSIVGCQKENDSKEESPRQLQEGTIEWGGPIEADGLGWTFLETGDSLQALQVLKNLPDAFKADGLPVRVVLESTTEQAPCFCGKYYTRVHTIERR